MTASIKSYTIPWGTITGRTGAIYKNHEIDNQKLYGKNDH